MANKTLSHVIMQVVFLDTERNLYELVALSQCFRVQGNQDTRSSPTSTKVGLFSAYGALDWGTGKGGITCP